MPCFRDERRAIVCASSSYDAVSFSTRCHPAQPVSVPILHPREIQALQSQNYPHRLMYIVMLWRESTIQRHAITMGATGTTYARPQHTHGKKGKTKDKVVKGEVNKSLLFVKSRRLRTVISTLSETLLRSALASDRYVVFALSFPTAAASEEHLLVDLP